MKRKGFTLVELLAVIVILSVMAIITIPIIGNVIEESKKKALEVSVNGLVESANYYSINNEGTYEFLFDENHKGETVKGESLDYNGTLEAEGKLYLDKEGNISICVYNDKYYAYKNYNSGIVVGSRKEDNCNIGYDVISNKYVAFLESEGMSSNVYSKEEVNNIIDGVENNININTNEITNIKGTIETLQNSLSNYALQSSLDTTNSNLDSLSSLISNNQNSINNLNKNKTALTYPNITSSVIELANSLSVGFYTFSLAGSQYVGNDIPAGHQYSHGFIIVRGSNSKVIQLYSNNGGKIFVTFNSVNGEDIEWLDWKEIAFK